MNGKSFFELTGVPTEFGVLLLIVGLILALIPYFPGQDLGKIKIPDNISPAGKKRLKIAGPIILVLLMLLYFPIWPIKFGPETLVEGRYEIDYVDPIGVNANASVIVAIGPEAAFLLASQSGAAPRLIDQDTIARKSESELIQPVLRNIIHREADIEISEKMSVELVGLEIIGDDPKRELTVGLSPTAEPTIWEWVVKAPAVLGPIPVFVRIYRGNDTNPIKVERFEIEVVPIEALARSAAIQSAVTVYAEASADSAVLFELPDSQSVQVLGKSEDGSWVKIATAEGAQGWIPVDSGDFGNLVGLQILATPAATQAAVATATQESNTADTDAATAAAQTATAAVAQTGTAQAAVDTSAASTETAQALAAAQTAVAATPVAQTGTAQAAADTSAASTETAQALAQTPSAIPTSTSTAMPTPTPTPIRELPNTGASAKFAFVTNLALIVLGLVLLALGIVTRIRQIRQD